MARSISGRARRGLIARGTSRQRFCYPRSPIGLVKYDGKEEKVVQNIFFSQCEDHHDYKGNPDDTSVKADSGSTNSENSSEQHCGLCPCDD